MSISASIRDWFSECPLLEEFRALFVDYLDDTESYTIEFTPTEPIIKRYIDGSTLRCLQFSFCSREQYDGLANIDTSAFYEKFAEWLENCNQKKDLPSLEDGKEAQSIKALTQGYLYDESGKYCQYRIQCEFIYYQEAI
jgi:hypothetical protein